MRLYFRRPRRKLFGATGKTSLLSLRVLIGNGQMRIGDGGLLPIDFNRVRPFLIMALHLHLDPRAMRTIPFQPSLPVDIRLVLGSVDRHKHFRSKLIACDTAYDMHGLPTVSCPYIPAAEIPMPCWPRDWLSLWNFEP